MPLPRTAGRRRQRLRLVLLELGILLLEARRELARLGQLLLRPAGDAGTRRGVYLARAAGKTSEQWTLRK